MDKKKRIQQVIELLESGKIEFIIPKNIEVDYLAYSYDFSTQKDNTTMYKIKCITFDKNAQNQLPQHIKDKMKADRDKARSK